MLILEIAPGSAAELASLLPGDLLIGADGKRFGSHMDLQEAIESAQSGVMEIEFYRADRSHVRKVTAVLDASREKTAA